MTAKKAAAVAGPATVKEAVTMTQTKRGSDKKGRQTPTKSLVLPYENTHGGEAVSIYEKTGRKVQEWQRLLLNDILAENADSLWVHTKAGYSVPRRNGKNEVVAMRELWGLLHGERILHTAHRTTTSHAAWERLCALLDKAKIEYTSVRATGRECIRLDDCGGAADFRTRSSKGGLGEGFDLLVIDEAQEYTDDQASALKYVVSDSQNPQTLFCGTPPTPVSSGTVFLKMRADALRGDANNTFWAEWSVDRETDVHDVAAWYETNPSLGTILTERKIADEISADTVDFNIQRLGLWLRYNQKSAVSRAEWDSLQCDSVPELSGKLFVGVKFGHDADAVALSVAVKTADGRCFVETVDCRPARDGFGWIVDFLTKADAQAVAVDGASGQQLLAAAMKEAKLKKPVLPTVKEIITAGASFEQALFAKQICHMGQPALAQAVSNCEKRAIGTNGGFGYRSLIEGVHIELMDSMILACWLCTRVKTKKAQKMF